MKLEEFIESITNDGLKDILHGMGESYSYPRPELIDRVLASAGNLSTRQALRLLKANDLKHICSDFQLPKTGTNQKLIDSIVSHEVKVVTFDVLVLDVKRWKPKKTYRSEQPYTDDLHGYLINKGYEIKTNCGRTKPDLLVNGQYPIEMKYCFSTKPEQNKATGQLNEYIKDFGCAILVVCEYYADHDDFNEEMDRLLHPGMKEKCVAICKQSFHGWKAYTMK